jgi:hypothetical protein
MSKVHSKKRRLAESGEVRSASKNKTTGRELTLIEEINARINTLIDLLDANSLIDKKQYERTLSMRLHEISKATAFEEMDIDV